jgi:branched-chain amino acid transport system ATP-binding protein
MTRPAIEIDRLSKHFGGLRAVDDVCLSVRPGERRVLIGPNGAGKTTLFNCVAGTQRPTAGRVLLFGKDISGLPENRRTAFGMARTFQISNVCTDLTVDENMTLAALSNDRRKWIMYRSSAKLPGLQDRVQAGLAIIGLNHRHGERVKLLSYGERRQLEVGIALISNPRVLLLDEPCAGLSPSERQKLSRLVAELPREITLVMIEHDIDVALAVADRVTVLHRGKVNLDGSPDQVQRDDQVREVYFGRV